MDIWTGTITIPLIITVADGFYRCSITAIGGPIEVTGNIAFNGVASTPIPILENGSVLLVANPNKPLAITINPLAASAALMLFFN